MADDDTPLLRAQGIRKAFGGLVAVDGMDIDVAAGEVVGLIGPNGAGKSTFFNCLSGFHIPEAGQAVFDGQDVTRLPMHRTARLGLVRTFQITRALARMTVHENLMLAPKGQVGERLAGAFAFRRWKRQEDDLSERVDETLERFDLAHLADEYAGALSGGQKKLLELARALMIDPRMMLLDEPMAGVNPTLAGRLMKRILELRDDHGMTFLLVEHDMETVFQHCDRVVVMAEGRNLADGSPDDIQGNTDVQEAYLGR